jgi:UDP-glucose 4-epimerase
MRIICTGAAGFIGSHICELLAKQKHSVLIIDNFSTGKLENVSEIIANYPKYVDLQEGDITILPFMNRVFAEYKPRLVIHLAAQAAITTAWDNPVKDITVNAIGTLNVIRASTAVGVEKIIFSSTSAVYRETNAKLKETSVTAPSNPYGISKLAAEYYLRSMFPNSTILRLGNVYGERQVPIGENQLIPRMIRHFKYGDTFFIHGDGKQERDFIYVGDVAQAIVMAFGSKPGIFNISTGQSFSVNDIADMIEEIYDVRGYKWDHTPENDPRRKVCMDISAAHSGLSWKPIVNIRAGIKNTVDWWEAK